MSKTCAATEPSHGKGGCVYERNDGSAGFLRPGLFLRLAVQGVLRGVFVDLVCVHVAAVEPVVGHRTRLHVGRRGD